MTKLFRSSEELLINEYTLEEIDQGFWFISGVNGFMWAFLDDSVDIEDRKNCIYSTQNLFLNLFSKYEIGTSGYMWWDSVFTYCTFKTKTIFEDMKILETIIQTIKNIKEQNTDISKLSAEHGIKHLTKHEGRTKPSS